MSLLPNKLLYVIPRAKLQEKNISKSYLKKKTALVLLLWKKKRTVHLLAAALMPCMTCTVPHLARWLLLDFH